MYNLAKRQAESEILPLAAHEEPRGHHLRPPGRRSALTGKYGPGTAAGPGAPGEKQEYAARYGEDWVYEVAGAFTAFAAAGGYDPVSLAVAWVAAHPAVTCPIIGARNLDQLQPSLAALEIDMNAGARRHDGGPRPGHRPAERRRRVSPRTPEKPP